MATKTKTPSKSKMNELPVAPEFVETLQENALCTLRAYLELLKVPQDVIDLTVAVNDLNYYLIQCWENPEQFKKDKKDRFDIENLVVETVNSIANLGGKFHGSYTYSNPREGSPLAEVKEEE